MVAPARCAVLATLLALALTAFAKPLVAESASWLVLEGVCPARSADLASRVEQELIGSRPPSVRAHVSIEAADAGYRMSVRAARGSQDLGQKQLVAATCDEAVDAAVVVLAIAFTELEQESEPAAAASETPLEVGWIDPQPRPSIEHDPARTENESTTRQGRRLGLLFGVETGTVPGAAPYVGMALALPIELWELWSALRYGLPTEEASVETATSEQTRRDFAALELSLCRGVGAAWRFSLCAGGEFGVVRVAHTRQDGDAETDTDEARPRVAAVGTTRLSGRAGMLRPELEFSAAAAAPGLGAGPALSLRLGAGVAVQF